MDKIINLLKQYKQVFLYRHINPDYDAFGSTVGMYCFLKENFPEINVVLKGALRMFYGKNSMPL